MSRSEETDVKTTQLFAQHSQHFAIKWTSFDTMQVESERGVLLYASRDTTLKCTVLFASVTLLLHVVARLQGRIQTRVHSGLHQFWSSLVVGELSTCLVCMLAAVSTYVIDNGQPDMLVCADFRPLQRYVAYAWLLVWVLFVVAVLRGTVAITWLNRISSAARLTDMLRGIGILCASLIYLFPLALLSRFASDEHSAHAQQPFTVCVPEFKHGADVTLLQFCLVTSWTLGIFVMHLLSGKMHERSVDMTYDAEVSWSIAVALFVARMSSLLDHIE